MKITEKPSVRDKIEIKYDTKRYTCVCDSMYKRPSFFRGDDITHYD